MPVRKGNNAATSHGYCRFASVVGAYVQSGIRSSYLPHEVARESDHDAASALSMLRHMKTRASRRKVKKRERCSASGILNSERRGEERFLALIRSGCSAEKDD